MNKIKIYFYDDWVYIAPPWLEVPENLKDVFYEDFNDIGINLKKGKAYITNNDYYCSVDADEMWVLARMLEIAAEICHCKMTYNDVKQSLAKAYIFRDVDIYMVEEAA